MKKEPLSIIIVKTLLAVIIFAGIGTIIVGGAWLIGKQGVISEPLKLIQQQPAEDKVTITTDKTDMPVLWALGSEPDAIPIANTTDVLFTTMQTGLEDRADKIIVEELDMSGSVIRILGDLNDNGINGDLVASDYIYSGTFRISSSKEGNLFFRAKANFPNISEPIYTDEYKFDITRFPAELYSSDMSKTVINPKTGQKMISNEVIVGFIEEVDSDIIENIIRAVGGEIIGTISGLGVYQVKVSDTGDATGVNNAINKLLNYPEVKYAEPNYIVEMD